MRRAILLAFGLALVAGTAGADAEFIKYIPATGVRFDPSLAIAIGYQAMTGAQGGGTYSVAGANIGIGYQAAYSNTTGRITAIGYQAGYSNGAGTDGVLTAVGYQAGYSNTTGHATFLGNTAGVFNTTAESTCVGDEACGSTTDKEVTAVGYYAAHASKTGFATALGFQAGYNFDGTAITAIGHNAAYTATAGNILAIGERALFNATTPASALAIGYQAGLAVTTGNVTLVGYQAGLAATTANTTAFGYKAAKAMVDGGVDTAIGYQAGMAHTTGWLTAVGYNAGAYLTTGYMTLLGHQAGLGAVDTNAPITDQYGILIGHNANRSVASATRLDNYIGIGYGTLIDKSNQVKIGNSTTTETNLYGDLLVNATGANGGLAFVLTADAVIQFGQTVMPDAGTANRFDVNASNGTGSIGVLGGTGASAQGTAYPVVFGGLARVAIAEDQDVALGEYLTQSATAGYCNAGAIATIGLNIGRTLETAVVTNTINPAGCTGGAGCINTALNTPNAGPAGQITLAADVAAQGWAVGDPVTYWNSGGATPTGLTDGATYWLVSVATTNVTIAASKGGAVVVPTSQGNDATQYLQKLPLAAIHIY